MDREIQQAFFFYNPFASALEVLNIRRELIERGGVSKLGLDLCRVTMNVLLADK
ncbi:hypothetical protein [Nitrospira moscoviensis]|uniref:hypothetical protein n=1 Tax=Nitrospira moscoviensis TaxID=42253 RepID=UPI000AFF5BE3|nr:hypothetical protein [Nitrospira moscoviensis]